MNINICSNSIVTLGKKIIPLLLCNTSHADSGNQYNTTFKEGEKKGDPVYEC